ncbi:2-isopropylmalate synthase [Stanieria cyanosphaera PCC 7437]|uniref:2-isopropylmalate synthase n=1 Tax=Stanieria cyanosphaera (strain ATCC 29371 / PCC 7437) TaxID=111780 RepID=K9Y007_STAC7|nr:2-isopropylmalate synthase [Stanieria cyanosphaera]AFZ37619.1 2-isopropylmalate synthase [Stanieria cyanosphaera PCC 7437]
MKSPIILFDTTMRDGELTPGVIINLKQKMQLAQLLEELKVDIIEVGYPGFYKKDFDEVFVISQVITKSIVCGLAGSKVKEIETLGEAIKPASRGRINIYTNVNTKIQSKFDQQQILELIQDSITLARNYCDDIQWSAFDAVNAQLDFLCQAVELAINSGAKTICIPDSFGTLSSEEFYNLISKIVNQVSNIDRAIISVHCHNDLGLAVENSIAALATGARQIECSINGLGARKGNADLAEIIKAVEQQNNSQISCEENLISQASDFVNRITQKFS